MIAVPCARSRLHAPLARLLASPLNDRTPSDCRPFRKVWSGSRTVTRIVSPSAITDVRPIVGLSMVLDEFDRVTVRVAAERLAHSEALVSAQDEVNPAFREPPLDDLQVLDLHCQVIGPADPAADLATGVRFLNQVDLAVADGEPCSRKTEGRPLVLGKPENFAEELLGRRQVCHRERDMVHSLESDSIHTGHCKARMPGRPAVVAELLPAAPEEPVCGHCTPVATASHLRRGARARRLAGYRAKVRWYQHCPSRLRTHHGQTRDR